MLYGSQAALATGVFFGLVLQSRVSLCYRVSCTYLRARHCFRMTRGNATPRKQASLSKNSRLPRYHSVRFLRATGLIHSDFLPILDPELAPGLLTITGQSAHFNGAVGRTSAASSASPASGRVSDSTLQRTVFWVCTSFWRT